MNKTIYRVLVIMVTISAVAYFVTNDDTAFLSTVICGAAALVVLSNKLKSAQ